LDGNDAPIVANAVDDRLAPLGGAWTLKLQIDVRIVHDMKQKQLVPNVIAEKRADESTVTRVRHVRGHLDRKA
jgi:hypothetical protein